MQPQAEDRRITPATLGFGLWGSRALSEADVDMVFDLLTDPDVAHVRPTPPPRDKAAALEWIREVTSSDQTVAWMIEETRTGRPAGTIMLQHLDPSHNTAEIGYLVAPWARRQGVATGALRAITEWVLRSTDLTSISLLHGLDNEPSCKVALAAGYQRDGIVERQERGVSVDYELHSIGRSPTERTVRSTMQIIGNLALLFTDIEGSTALLQRVGHPRYVELLDLHHHIIRDVIAAHDGEEIATEGDSFAVLFRSSVTAVSAAVEAQRRLGTTAWPGDNTIEVRMGVHVGQVGVSEIGHHGLALHETARVAGVGHGGQIVVSQTAHDSFTEAPDRDAEVELKMLGKFELKDIGNSVPLYQVVHPALAHEFPPLRASGSTQHNLPAQLTNLVGRDSEVAELVDHIDVHRLVSLLGTGGIGKTRLALRVAADSARRFPDGIWFVDLATLSPDSSIAEEIRRAMRLPDSGRGSAALIDDLAHSRALLVLDNCEHVIETVAHIAGELLRACASVHILTTSREPLGAPGEVHWRVPSLNVSEATALFVDRARMVLPTLTVEPSDQAALERICTRLDGIPLAIELAASRVGTIPIDELEHRLLDQFRLLASGQRGQVARHQTLRATLDWSYRLLTSEEQCLFRRLAVLRGPTEIAAIEATCGVPPLRPRDIPELIESLHAKSLTKMDTSIRPARVHLSEVVRQFVTNLAEDAGDDTATLASRHADYFLAFSSEALHGMRGPDRHLWLRRMDADRDNFAAATDWLSIHRPDDAAQLIVNTKEWLLASTDAATLERLRALSERTDITPAAIAMTNALRAQLAGSYGQESADTAAQAADRALHHLASVHDPRERIRTLTNTALGFRESDPDSAAELTLRAVDEALALGDDTETAAALSDLIFVQHEHHPETMRLRTMLLGLMDRLGTEWPNVQALVDEALSCHQVGEHDVALTHLSRAEEILMRSPRQRFGMTEDAQVWTVWNVLLRAEIGDTEGAILLGEEAIATLGETDSISARTLHGSYGQALLIAGRISDARREFLLALDQPDPWRYLGCAIATIGLGEVELAEGAARDAYERAAPVASGNRRDWVRARAHDLMARASIQLRDRATAAEHVRQADSLRSRHGFVVPPALQSRWAAARDATEPDPPLRVH